MIEISLNGGGVAKFRASVRVARDLGAINGSVTGDGPWVGGFGDSPDEALMNLYKEVGRLYVMKLEASR